MVADGLRVRLVFLTTKLFSVAFINLHAWNTRPLAAAWANCDLLEFGYNASHPYGPAQSNAQEGLFTFRTGCEAQQSCLFADDAAIADLGFAAYNLFPTRLDAHSDENPRNGWDIVANAYVTYDRYTSMHIQNIGTYYGPREVGIYFGVPVIMWDQGLGTQGLDRILAIEGRAGYGNWRTEMSVALKNTWLHNQPAHFPQSIENWHYSTDNYPCSALMHHKTFQFPLRIESEFSRSALPEFNDTRLPRHEPPALLAPTSNQTIGRICDVVMRFCDHNANETIRKAASQFEGSHKKCVRYLHSLPPHDEKCQRKYSPTTALGHSLACKYLHHFMIPFEPNLHCFHVGAWRKNSVNTPRGIKPTSRGEALSNTSLLCNDAREIRKIVKAIFWGIVRDVFLRFCSILSFIG